MTAMNGQRNAAPRLPSLGAENRDANKGHRIKCSVAGARCSSLAVQLSFSQSSNAEASSGAGLPAGSSKLCAFGMRKVIS